MKKLLSSVLAALLTVSCIFTPGALAVDYSTKVEYESVNAESFLLTVPGDMIAGTSGNVTLKGKWPSNKTFNVTADTSVEMTCNLGSSKTLTVTFPGISLAGSNTVEVTDTKQVSVAEMTGVLFGTWSGTFRYNVASSEEDWSEATNFTVTRENRGAVGYTDEATTLEIPANFVGDGEDGTTDDEKYKVVAIGDGAFSNCTTLETVTLPSTVTSIGKNAFLGCTNLTTIDVPEDASVGSGAFADCPNLSNAPEETMRLSSSTLTMDIGDTHQLTVTSKYSDAYSWSSSASDVVEVSQTGLLTAKKAGNAVITVAQGDISVICNVTVNDFALSLNKCTLSLEKGDTETLTASFTPADAANYNTVTWSSSEPDIVSIENGTITAEDWGSATITATAGDKTATCTVTVPQILDTVQLSSTTLTMDIGDTHQLTATSRYRETYEWNSSASDVVEVSRTGLLTAKKAGSATIAVTQGEESATCNVTVNDFSISLNKSTLSLEKGSSETLTATFSPAGASTYNTVTWSSSAPSIVSVDNGVLAANNWGSAVITATAGGKTATCNITVPQILSAVELSSTTLTLTIGGTHQLTATSKYREAYDWSSSAPSVAEVSSTGLVTAKATGSAIITVTQGDVSTTCSVTVKGMENFTITASNRAAVGYIGEGDEVLYIPATFVGDGNNGTVSGVKYKVTSIGQQAFNNCRSLIRITVPEGVTSIEANAFAGCSGLTKATIAKSVTNIGNYAFSRCTGLSNINFGGTKAEWNAIAKGSGWDSISGTSYTPGSINYTVHCTDGDITNS